MRIVDSNCTKPNETRSTNIKVEELKKMIHAIPNINNERKEELAEECRLIILMVDKAMNKGYIDDALILSHSLASYLASYETLQLTIKDIKES